MEKLKKVLLSSGLGVMLLSNSSFATTAVETTKEVDVTKILLLVAAVVLIVVVLYFSYKMDSPSEAKPKAEKKVNKKDKLKDELVEKDNTYEVEENEFYEDDKIEPVSIGKDEDEISLFESVNNPDTERVAEVEVAEEESAGFMTRANMEANNEVKKSNRDMFDKAPKFKDDDETVNDFFSMDEDVSNVEEDILESEPENNVEENSEDEFDYNYDDIEEEINKANNSKSAEGTMVFNSAELNSKIDIFANDEEESTTEDDDEYNYDYEYDFDDKKEEEEKVEEKEDLFADVKEEPTEFVGFTTLKPKTQSRGGNSRFDRPNVEREEVVEVKEKESDGNSANDFLAQMERNLGGESVAPKKTATKKTTTKADSAKKTTAKKAPAKKTTTTKTKADKK